MPHPSGGYDRRLRGASTRSSARFPQCAPCSRGPPVRTSARSETQPPYCPADFKLPRRVAVNLVEVVEREPPQGEEPVRWLLFTSEPVATPADLIRLVRIYRKHWLIEEFFKSLKTGCKLEERQMNSASALLKAMALLLPVAWHLLLLRAVGRAHPDLPWTTVLPPLTFRILSHARPEAGLTEESTVRDVLYAIAAMGGHIKNNGAPGWLTLHRGFARLLELEQGYLIYERMNRSGGLASTH